MNRRVFMGTSAALAAASLARGAERPPNVIFLLADDLGYGDLGCYGQKRIRTPHLDALAGGGLRFGRHYAGNAVCAPSRCVFLTGRHPGHAFVRENREVQPEGQLPLPADTVTLAGLLKSRGYATGCVGKWGLGAPGSVGAPENQGFDRFYGYNCQRVAHNAYPTYLWDNTQRVPLDNPAFAAHQKLPADADPDDPKTYERYVGRQYAPDLIADAALDFVRANRARPFFLWWTTIVPHLALQVPADSLAEYAGAFPEKPYDGSRGYLPQRTPRAAYAAMVTRLDAALGRLMALLGELGLDDNTLVVFASDNGPLYDELGGTDCEFFNSAGGLRGRKGSLYEGGVRVPCIARWPGKIQPGTQSDRVGGFEDWLPTLCELAGAQAPANADGLSLAPTLLGRAQPERPWLYREFAGYSGWQALWQGRYKAVRSKLQTPRTTTPWELYDIAADPAEAQDLAAEQPERLRAMAALATAQHVPSAEFPIKGLDV
ncbi:MAG: arylsulfatase [Armatimonadetes bacterium]|nr:arylsulfatase [Armatimonadota bacterium]